MLKSSPSYLNSTYVPYHGILHLPENSGVLVFSSKILISRTDYVLIALLFCNHF